MFCRTKFQDAGAGASGRRSGDTNQHQCYSGDDGNILTKHDAIIVAFGARCLKPRITRSKISGVMNATEFLTKAKTALARGVNPPEFKGATVPVLVLGGSDTAIDVARSVLRLGGKPIIIHRGKKNIHGPGPMKSPRLRMKASSSFCYQSGQTGRRKRQTAQGSNRENTSEETGCRTDIVNGTNRLSIPTWSSWRRGINLNRDLRRYLSCQSSTA